MALWGKTDTLASTPKWVARKATFDGASASVVSASANTISLVASNTGFNTGDAVYYTNGGGADIGGLTNGSTYTVRVVGAGVIELYDTYNNAIAAEPTKTGRVDISAVGTGTAHTLQRTGVSNIFDDSNFNGAAIVFVDAGEATVTANRAKGIKNPGWWLYRSWTNADGSVAKHAECLVAMNGSDVDLVPGTTGDREDTIAVDAVITIGTQPVAASVTAPATATFSIAATVPAGTVTYQWQVQEAGAGAWANVSRGTGGTTATYTTAATLVAGASGASTADSGTDKYRCIVSASGYADVTSDAVALTVA